MSFPNYEQLWNQSPGYINGLVPSYTSATTFTVSPGICRDSTGANDMSLGSATVLNTAVNGVNGLDTGSLAASTAYFVFLISDVTGANQPALLMSDSTIPVMPTGYSLLRQIGWMFTNSSSQFSKFYVFGSSNNRKFWWVQPDLILNGGSNVSRQTRGLDGWVAPVDKTPVTFITSIVPASAGNYFSIGAYADSPTATLTSYVTGPVASVKSSAQLTAFTTLATTSPSIEWIGSSNSDVISLAVQSFDFYV